MSTIRRQSILSTLLIYAGFAFGALNMYLFARKDIFTPEEYGLTRGITAMGNFFYGFASLGLLSVIYKFFPYYKGNLKPKQNDLLTLCLIVALLGFILTASAGLYFEPLVVRKFSAKSQLLVRYYVWVIPYLFFYLFFSILEAYAWTIKKTVLANFLREGGFRITTTVLIIIFIMGGIYFDLFIKLFSCIYAVSFLILLFYLISTGEFHLTFKLSRVTKKFWKKMLTLVSFVYFATLINIIAQSIDAFAIASYLDQAMIMLAVFEFSNYLSNVIQVPQRSIVSISVGYLSQAWKDKHYATIQRIYSRSSLNMLMASLFIFLTIWLNFDRAIEQLHLNPVYHEGKWVVLILGIKNIIDMGTGVNSMIIGTSIYWRFELYCSLLLLLNIPMNMWLVKEYGIQGAAISNLIVFTLYNLIRLVFLWVKFNMQPFSINTVGMLINGLLCYGIAYFTFRNITGWTGIIGSSAVFMLLFIAAAFYFKLSPDIMPVWKSIVNRFKRES
jgi:O-antigen/teichoic acid export membrane protein